MFLDFSSLLEAEVPTFPFEKENFLICEFNNAIMAAGNMVAMRLTMYVDPKISAE